MDTLIAVGPRYPQPLTKASQRINCQLSCFTETWVSPPFLLRCLSFLTSLSIPPPHLQFGLSMVEGDSNIQRASEMALTVLTRPPPGPELHPGACLEFLLNILRGFWLRCPWLLLLPGRLYAPLGNFLTNRIHLAFRWALSFPRLLDTLPVPTMLGLPTVPALGTPSFSYQCCPFRTCHSDSVLFKKEPVSHSGLLTEFLFS